MQPKASIIAVILSVVAAGAGQSVAQNADRAGVHEHVVSTDADAGPGSLRAVLLEANRSPGPDRIVFGDIHGPFATPNTIRLRAPLPAIEGEVTIDGFIDSLLWKAYGATISGAGRQRLFEIAPQGSLHLLGLTLIEGTAEQGGAILNRGRLVLSGVTLRHNRAEREGGALANLGSAVLINSTVADNRARRGGGLANLGGELRVTHGTLYRNAAGRGAALYSDGALYLANSILADAPDGDADEQCRNTGALDPASTHNLIQGRNSRGCGDPIRTDDPRLDEIGYYNGPAPVFPLGTGSPAVNLGSNAAARDEHGQPLKWDQRGNGDPRYAAGYADLGAFEQQAPIAREFVVDTIADTGLRACSIAGVADCPLRAALELSAAARELTPIRFHPGVFAEPQVIALPTLPEIVDRAFVLDGEGVAPVTILVPRAGLPWQALNGVRIETTFMQSRHVPDEAERQ